MASNQNAGTKTGQIILVILVLIAVGASAIYRRRPPPANHAQKFQVPAADRMAIGAAVRVDPAIVPGGQLITLDPTGKFLINSVTNKPVFITGEDAFSLQSQLSDSDIQLYLKDRAAKGFNVIWVGLADNFYSNHPPKDFAGNAPFSGPDFTNENPLYWKRVDQTLKWAAENGITVLANPAFVGYGCKEGYCESYRNSAAEVVTAYGRFLGARYKAYPNIIWLIGGDANDADTNVQQKLYALATGIKSEDAVHLMTTENYRGTASEEIWSDAPWLDLNALYLTPQDIVARTSAAYRTSRRPMFLVEDWYEGAHAMTELDIRKEGYAAVLSGCTLGRLFGNYAIWNFTFAPETKDAWKDQLDSEGSKQQALLGKLFRSREHWKLVPDLEHTTLTAGYDSRGLLSSTKESVRSWVYQTAKRPDAMGSVAARTTDGQTIIAYVPQGSAATVTIDMKMITDPSSQAKGWWFDPRTGVATLIGTFATNGSHNFTGPDANDWILVIDSAAANLAAPGNAAN